MIYSGWKFVLFLVFGGMTSKATLSHTTVFLLQVMHFAKLNKPPGGLNRGFTVLLNDGNLYFKLANYNLS